MSSAPMLEPSEVVSRLEVLSTLDVPWWISAGVAVDLHVGAWTRRHGDLDVVSFHEHRPDLEQQLNDRRITLAQGGAWTTKWSFRGHQPADVEIVFVEPDEARRSGVLVVPEYDPAGGTAGRYPFIDGYLDPDRWERFDGGRVRITSAEGEWFNRAGQDTVVAGRSREPKIDHDLRLLERLVPLSTRLALQRTADPST